MFQSKSLTFLIEFWTPNQVNCGLASISNDNVISHYRDNFNLKKKKKKCQSVLLKNLHILVKKTHIGPTVQKSKNQPHQF